LDGKQEVAQASGLQAVPEVAQASGLHLFFLTYHICIQEGIFSVSLPKPPFFSGAVSLSESVSISDCRFPKGY
jgi:hypothetical protein